MQINKTLARINAQSVELQAKAGKPSPPQEDTYQPSLPTMSDLRQARVRFVKGALEGIEVGAVGCAGGALVGGILGAQSQLGPYWGATVGLVSGPLIGALVLGIAAVVSMEEAS